MHTHIHSHACTHTCMHTHTHTHTHNYERSQDHKSWCRLFRFSSGGVRAHICIHMCACAYIWKGEGAALTHCDSYSVCVCVCVCMHPCECVHVCIRGEVKLIVIGTVCMCENVYCFLHSPCTVNIYSHMEVFYTPCKLSVIHTFSVSWLVGWSVSVDSWHSSTVEKKNGQWSLIFWRETRIIPNSARKWKSCYRKRRLVTQAITWQLLCWVSPALAFLLCSRLHPNMIVL